MLYVIQDFKKLDKACLVLYKGLRGLHIFVCEALFGSNLRAWFRDLDIIDSWIRDQRLLRAATFVKHWAVILWDGPVYQTLLSNAISSWLQAENHKALAFIWS